MTEFKSPMFYKYLSGRVFSVGESFSYDSQCQHTRLDFLKDFCAGKTVLHIGACDHLPLLKKKQEAGIWLHDILTDSSNSVLGIDINNDAVVAANNAGAKNIIFGDITIPGIKEINAKTWDVCVFGEIIEHIGNPVDFLKSFAENYGQSINCIVITVPNARSLGQITNSLRGFEKINTDHRFDFTPFTISKILYDAGYVVSDLHFTYNKSVSLLSMTLKKLILKFFPLFSDGVIAIARLKNSGE